MNKASVSVLVAIATIFILVQLCSATPATASSPIVSVAPSYINTSPWQTFTVNITVDPSDNKILGAEYELYFNPRMLQVVSQTQGNFLSQDGANTIVYNNSWDNTTGRAKYAEARTVDYGVNAPGVLASITFKTRYVAGNSTLDLKNVILVNTSGECSNIEINDGLVEIEVTPTPFSVYGYVFYGNDSECDNPTVKIINLNTGAEWSADTRHDSCYYQCNLTAGIDVVEGDTLLFRTTSPEGQQINTTYHEITRAEINNGGIFNFNISLEPVRHDINVSTDYYPPTGIKIENATAIMPHEQHLTTGTTYFIKYEVENEGNIDENVSITVTVKATNTSWETVIKDYNKRITAGESFEGNDSWDSSGFAPGNYKVVVNASVPEDDAPWNNLREREIVLEVPQLVISSLVINPACANVINKAFSNETNEICATILNTGTEDAGKFNVSFEIDGMLINKSLVEGLGASTNATFCVPWTPQSIGNYQLKVELDDGLVTRTMLKNVTVYNNGYKGKRYTGGKDIKTVQVYEGKVNIFYSVGDSYCLGNDITSYWYWTRYSVNWTAENLRIPHDAHIKNARLYVYYDSDGTSGGNITDYFNLTFNGVPRTIDALYKDRMGFGNENTPVGMAVYNVTADFYASADNRAILYNEYQGYVKILGMVLLGVYEHADEQQRVIWINEGFDLLKADDDYCVNATEATAFVPFEGTINLTVESAKLITIAPQACDEDDKNSLYFNDGEWHGIWDHYPPAPPAHPDDPPELGINETDVTENLHSWGNMARMQSNSGGMEASNAILVVEGKFNVFDTRPGGYPSIMGTHNGTIIPDRTITVRKLYTYFCPGTGGHTECIKIWNETINEYAEAHWNGYIEEDYHNISFNEPLTLKKGVIYNYTIRTGSYPQIIHAKEYPAIGGVIKCEEFIDVNGKRYTDWIPAIRLYQ